MAEPAADLQRMEAAVRGLAAQQHGTVALPGDLELHARAYCADGIVIAASLVADELCILFLDPRGGAQRFIRSQRSCRPARSRRLSGGRTRQLWRPT